MLYLSNAFSLQMLDKFPAEIMVREVSNWFLIEQLTICGFKSVIGHEDTARVVSTLLQDMNIPCNRENITLKKGDHLVVFQLTGGRLPEGATTLPEGFTHKFLWVEIK